MCHIWMHELTLYSQSVQPGTATKTTNNKKRKRNITDEYSEWRVWRMTVVLHVVLMLYSESRDFLYCQNNWFCSLIQGRKLTLCNCYWSCMTMAIQKHGLSVFRSKIPNLNALKCSSVTILSYIQNSCFFTSVLLNQKLQKYLKSTSS